jgi:hypothetical protein
MDEKPVRPTRVGKLQIFHCKMIQLPPGTKSTAKRDIPLLGTDRATGRRLRVYLGSVFIALVVGILIGRFLLG